MYVARRETELASMYEARQKEQQKSAAYTSPSYSGLDYVSDEVLPTRRQLRDVEPRSAQPQSVCNTTLLLRCEILFVKQFRTRLC